MTTEERRIKILEKRLRLLGEYLERFSDGDGPSFAEFAKSKDITYEMFVKDLPPGFENVPASGYDNVLEYALQLNELLNGQRNLSEMEEIAADGNNLERGVTDYYGQYIREDCGCGGGSEDDNSASADGDEFSAAGCGLPPVPPPFPNPKKTNNAITRAARKSWDKYKEKHAKYRRCVNAQKEKRKGYSLNDKASHALHLSNPSEAIGRVAFLKLIALNIFGLAQTYERMRSHPNQTHWDRMKKLWYRLGGSEVKLDKNISIGRGKKPIFRPKGWKPKPLNADGGIYSADGGVWHNAYDGIAIGGMITAATGLIGSVAPIIKSFKKDNAEPDADTYDPLNPDMRLPEDTELPDDTGVDGDGLTTNQWIGISAGVAVVLGVIIFAGYKMSKEIIN